MMEISKSDEKKKLTNNQANNQTYLNMEFIYSNDNSLNMDTVYVYGCLSIKKIFFFSLSLSINVYQIDKWILLLLKIDDAYSFPSTSLLKIGYQTNKQTNSGLFWKN